MGWQLKFIGVNLRITIKNEPNAKNILGVQIQEYELHHICANWNCLIFRIRG